MKKVLDIYSLYMYREAVRRLEENNIQFNTSKLLEDPELCMEIIKIVDSFNKADKE